MQSVAATMDEEPGILQHRIFPEKENFEGGSSDAGQMSSWQLCQWTPRTDGAPIVLENFRWSCKQQPPLLRRYYLFKISFLLSIIII